MTTAWWPCRCIGCTSPLWFSMWNATTSPSDTVYIGMSGQRWPLMVHHRPGLPLRNPGRRPMEYSKLRSGSSVSKGSGSGDPYVSRSSSAFGCGGRLAAVASSGPMTHAVAAPDCTRTVPDVGTVTSRSARPPAGTVRTTSVDRRRLVQIAAVDGQHTEGLGRPDRHRAVVGVHDPHADLLIGLGRHADDVLRAVEGAGSPVGVGDAQEILLLVDAVLRQDHEGAEQSADHLFVRDLVGVVPERPDLVGDEAVRVLAALFDRVLGDPGHAVLGIRHVDAVPVQGDAVLDGGVAQDAPR